MTEEKARELSTETIAMMLRVLNNSFHVAEIKIEKIPNPEAGNNEFEYAIVCKLFNSDPKECSDLNCLLADTIVEHCGDSVIEDSFLTAFFLPACSMDFLYKDDF